MHVDDVGAHRHMNGYRDVQTMRGNRDAVIGKRRIALRQKRPPPPAQAMPVICAMPDGLVEEHAVSSAMPNRPWASDSSTSSEVAPASRFRSHE